MQQNQTDETPSFREQIAQNREAVHEQIAQGRPNEEASAQPAASEEPTDTPTQAESTEGQEQAPAQTPTEGEAQPQEAQAPKAKIRIGTEEFETQEEALAYAERLEADKLAAEAYNQGIQDTIAQQPQQPAQDQDEEENFNEHFYSDPKKYLDKVKSDALGVIRQEQAVEALWTKFFNKYPDLEGNRDLCQMVYNQNAAVLGNMRDADKAMQILATKTRSIFQDYAEKTKPKSNLPNQGAGIAGGTQTQPSVTQSKAADEPVDFINQIRNMRKK